MVAPVIYADGLPPLGAVVAQVIHGQETAVLLHLGDHILAQPAAVHCPGALVGYEAEGVRQILLHEAIPRPGWDPVVAVYLLCVLGERRVLGSEPSGQLLADGETFIRIPYGGVRRAAAPAGAAVVREGLPRPQV